MDGRGGCLIARYDDGVSKVDRIMLRFRPIAPKPPASGSGSVSSPETSEANTRIGGRGRRKRCYAGKRKRKATSSVNSRPNEKKPPAPAAVTLPLLPETPDRRSSPATTKPSNRTSWLSFGGSNGDYYDNDNHREVEVAPAPSRVVGSCVTVESVEDTCRYGGGASLFPGRINLERDTCPGFISDGYGRVTWTNEAYREMVCGGEAGMVVWLVTRESAPVKAEAFTCRVRVEYGGVTSPAAPRRSVTVPCDVWRMEGGGFAWRLDIDAALRLGR